jgi:hypothetical protein
MTRKEVMKAQKIEAIEQFIEEDIYTYVERNLGLDYRVLLEDDIITPYIQRLIDQSEHFKNQAGSRSYIDFLKQLIYSRCVEIRLLKKWGKKAELNGSDRLMLISKFSSYSPDIRETDVDYYYEVMSTYNGQFVLNSSLLIKAEKLDHLCEFAKYHNTCIVAIDVLAKVYCFIPILPDKDEMYKKVMITPAGVQISLKEVDWFTLGEPDLVG